MTFRKEDHQALQDMYHCRIKKDAKDNDVLELVATIPAKDMPLPIRGEEVECHPGARRRDPSCRELRRSRMAGCRGQAPA